MQRRVAGTVHLFGTDDETFGSDEHVENKQNVEFILTGDNPEQFRKLADVRWGGECRVEVSTAARLMKNFNVLLTVTGKLFEGTDDDTTDKEDEKTNTYVIPKGGRPVNFDMYLVSEGFGGGDHAELYMTFTNSFLEEE